MYEHNNTIIMYTIKWRNVIKDENNCLVEIYWYCSNFLWTFCCCLFVFASVSRVSGLRNRHIIIRRHNFLYSVSEWRGTTYLAIRVWGGCQSVMCFGWLSFGIYICISLPTPHELVTMSLWLCEKKGKQKVWFFLVYQQNEMKTEWELKWK